MSNHAKRLALPLALMLAAPTAVFAQAGPNAAGENPGVPQAEPAAGPTDYDRRVDDGLVCSLINPAIDAQGRVTLDAYRDSQAARFTEIDRNGDGSVSTEEYFNYQDCLRSVLGASMAVAEGERSDEAFTRLDPSNTGFITREQFMIGAEEAFMAGAGALGQIATDAYRSAMQGFTQYDGAAGAATPGQAPADGQQSIGAHFAAADAAATFEWLDIDGDGLVSREEWRVMDLTEEDYAERARSAAERRFERLSQGGQTIARDQWLGTTTEEWPPEGLSIWRIPSSPVPSTQQ